MDKVERLMNLTMALLQTQRPLTAAELRERIPGYPDNEAAFRRAFERDKESLREMGIPLQLTTVGFTDPPIEGYRIAEEDYYLRDPGLDPDELAALHLASTAVRLETGHGLEALWKLGGVADGADLPVAERSAPLAELPDDPNLGPLFGALIDRRTVELGYKGEARRLDPYRLDYRRGRWYLTGHDHDRGATRNFRVDRIEGRVTTGPEGAFERPAGGTGAGPGEPWQFAEDDPVTARLLVDAGHAAWARRHLGDDAVVEERPGGAVVVELEVTNRDAFRSFVLTFLDHAEVLGPPELRDDLVAWLTAIVDGAA